MNADPLLDELDQALEDGGPSAVVERLVSAIESRDDPRALLDALLLKARHELGLPPVQAKSSLADLPEPLRSQYEDRYVEAVRRVGGRLLDRGDIVAAWPYFRAIGERDPVADAVEKFRPGDGDSSVGHVVEVAFTQGANPRRGYELILDHFGICSAITAFEGLPNDEALRVACATLLTRRLHEQLAAGLRADIERHGDPEPPEGASIPDLIGGRAWLFEDDAYHVDVSHLGAVVRVAPMIEDRGALREALGLAEYGRRLSGRHQYEGDPPFERLYEDHAIYLRALLGEGVDEAIAHFGTKIEAEDPEDPGDRMPTQVLVRLLVRLGRLDEAIEVSAGRLAGVPEGMLSVPGVSQLCARAGRMRRLAEIARAEADPVRYAAALLPGSSS